MKKALFALILGLAAAPAAWACSDPASCHQKNMNDWHYLNEVRPQELQRAQQQTTRSSSYYESRYGAIAQSIETSRTFSNSNHRSQEEANDAALENCKQSEPGTTCELLHTYYNGCLAIVIDGTKRPYYGFSESGKWSAKRKGMQLCKANGSGSCTHYASMCSMPVLVRY